jgi:hypothetical protein
MLKRRDVLQPVFDFLEREGYSVPNRWTKQFSDSPQEKLANSQEQRVLRSIIATHPEKGTLLIEAYGETSKPTLERGSGKRDVEDRVMNESESFTCVSRAIHGAACRRFSRDKQADDTIVLCFPHTHSFWKYLRPAKDALGLLGIVVYLVRGDQSVVRF